MARAIRINVADGWYHVTGRGIERREILGAAGEGEHFLELLEEMSERYGVEVHAYALMGNHYHLLIRTPEANASRAMQWLNVSYSVWFNKRRQRVGPVFQGRFGGVLIDGNGSWSLNASVYIHLNPVRTAGHGLGKAANRAEGLGLVKPTGVDLKRRLKALREFRVEFVPRLCRVRRQGPLAAHGRAAETGRRLPGIQAVRAEACNAGDRSRGFRGLGRAGGAGGSGTS